MKEKLVRDMIPQIIEAQGRDCEYRIADKIEYHKLLIDKLDEEVSEFKEAENLEELADVLEVIFALAKEMGYDMKDLMEKNTKKRYERGSFDDRIVLKMD